MIDEKEHPIRDIIVGLTAIVLAPLAFAAVLIAVGWLFGAGS